MRKLTIMLVAACLLAVPAMASNTYTYSWAASDADYLGCFDQTMNTYVAPTFNRPGSAGNGLALEKALSGGGNARGFLASVWNLQDGDEITVSVWRYDNSSGALPYFRLWSHYNDQLGQVADARGQDMQVNDGECYGNNDFGAQTGWEQFSWTWTVENGHTGMIIDAVVYGGAAATIYVDDIVVTVPDHVSVRMPNAIYLSGGGVTATESDTWSAVKAIFQ